jgi:polar amino acid transport system substrate-binding protein
MTTNRRIFLERGAALAAIATGLAGRASPAVAQPASASIPKTLRVGVANELPYSFLDSQGVLSGQSFEVLRAALADAGVEKFDGLLTDFVALIPGLNAKRFDVVCTGMFIRPARCEQIAFGNIDSMGRMGMIVPTGNPKKLSGFADFVKNPELRLSYIRGSVVEGYAKAAKVPEAQLVVLPDFTTLLAALKGGRADAAMGGYIILNATLKKVNDPGLQLLDKFVDVVVNGKPAVDYAAMGFRKEDNALREAYNRGLAKLIASGKLVEINERWGIPASLTATASTPKPEEICKG